MTYTALPGYFPSGWFAPTLVPEAPARGQPLRLAVISEGLLSWPLYVAQAKKLFERAGVTVEVTLTASSARQLEQLTTNHRIYA